MFGWIARKALSDMQESGDFDRVIHSAIAETFEEYASRKDTPPKAAAELRAMADRCRRDTPR